MTPNATAPGIVRTGRAAYGRLVMSVFLGALGIAATFVPALSTDELAWVALLPLGLLVLWSALPLHLAALRSLGSARWTPDALGSIGILAAFAWSAAELVAGRSASHLVPSVVAALVMAGAHHVGDEAGVEDPYESSPGWLTPLVLLATAATMATWWILDGPREAGSAALAVLLVAGPGALRLAVPAAMLVSRQRGEEGGVLSIDAGALAASRRVDTIVLDKDGTVTTGELSVQAVDVLDPDHLRNLRWFAGALEHCSEHPIGHAIAKLSARGRVTDVVHEAGLGIRGRVDRHPVRVGRPSWIGIEAPTGLGTRVGVEVDGRALGLITVADTVRDDARQGVIRLRDLGLDPILVSDRPAADTESLADQTGITTSHALATIEERVSLVQSLKADGRVVVMVGESHRNAEAMRAADLALGTSSEPSGNGIELADLDVQSVGASIALLRATSSTVLTNRRWAIVAALVAVPLAAAGLVPPMYAALFSAACAAGVVLNSMRLPRLTRSSA